MKFAYSDISQSWLSSLYTLSRNWWNFSCLIDRMHDLSEIISFLSHIKQLIFLTVLEWCYHWINKIKRVSNLLILNSLNLSYVRAMTHIFLICETLVAKFSRSNLRIWIKAAESLTSHWSMVRFHLNRCTPNSHLFYSFLPASADTQNRQEQFLCLF